MLTQGYFAVIVLVSGLGMLFYAFFSLSRALASLSWPTVDGVVTSSCIEERIEDDSTDYIPKITYSYSIGEFQYAGSDVRAGGVSWGSFRSAERVTKKYRVGAPVRVRYLSRDPAISLLESGFNFSIAVYFTVSAVLLVGALMAMSQLW